MNKQRFVQIISGQEIIKKDDLKKIQDLEKDYPYSQVLHTLSAIGSYRNKLQDSRQKLNIAAVYSADRAVLKDVVLSDDGGAGQIRKTNTKSELKTTPIAKKSADIDKQETKKDQTKPEISKPASNIIVDTPTKHPGHLTSKEADDLRNEVMKNLENLMIIKSNFIKDFLMDEGAEVKKKSKKGEKKQKKDRKGEVKSSKKNILKILSDPTAVVKADQSRPEENQNRISKKEQSEIIERFINEEPKLKRAKKESENKDQDDLSLESVAFGKDLVSENLAKILIKQGKKQKAIDIYKKLIWKYPQKKAYFASQIESITKK